MDLYLNCPMKALQIHNLFQPVIFKREVNCFPTLLAYEK